MLAPGRFSAATARSLTYICSLFVVALPHLPVCKIGLGRATGAAQGAASLLTVMRAFQTLHKIEARDSKWERTNGRWRRFYQGCGLSWHDLDEGRARALQGPAMAEHTSMVFYRLLLYTALMVIPAVLISWLPAPGSILSALMLVRCLLMSGALVAAFNHQAPDRALNNLTVSVSPNGKPEVGRSFRAKDAGDDYLLNTFFL